MLSIIAPEARECVDVSLVFRFAEVCDEPEVVRRIGYKLEFIAAERQTLSIAVSQTSQVRSPKLVPDRIDLRSRVHARNRVCLLAVIVSYVGVNFPLP